MCNVISFSVNPSFIEISILLSNWPAETYCALKANCNVIHSIPSWTYDYTQIGQTVYTEVCVPIGDTIVFTINDTYGDGIGGGSVVGSCLVTNTDCLDTIFNLNPPNFGFSASSAFYVAGVCDGNTPIFGCMDDDYVEYTEFANTDDGTCNT